MWRLSVRLIIAMFVKFVINLIFFNFIFWVFGGFFNLKPLGILAYGVFFTVILIFIEWLLGPSMVSSIFNANWIERSDDPVLWSMIHEEAKRARVKVRKIGIVDNEAPNAFAYAFLTGRPHLVFTKGMLLNMTYSEMRAVACYLIGIAKARLEKRRPGFGSFVSAGLGYLPFVIIYPQSVMISKIMSIFGDELSIEQTEDPSKFISALIKVSGGYATKPLDTFRTKGTPLKCLMFQDPTTALRDTNAMKEAAVKWGINLGRLVDLKGFSLPEDEQISLHAFERFWSHPSLVERLEHAIEFGKKVQAPIKIGLSWIE